MTTPMTVTESKLHDGSLTLAGTEFSCQASNVTLTPEYKEDGDPVPVLCGVTLPVATTVSWTLKVTAIQDFSDPDGLMRYLREHLLETVAFTWKAAPESETASGEVQIRLADWGGDVAKRLTTSLEWPIVGDITWTAPAALLAEATA